MNTIEIPEHNRRVIQEALNDLPESGGVVDVDRLPLLRVNGKTPVAPLFTARGVVPKLVLPQNFAAHNDDK